MKELMNLKESKKSNLLVAFFVRDLDNKKDLEETLFSISKQTKDVDALIIHAPMSENDMSELKNIIEHPHISVLEKQQDDQEKAVEKRVESDKKINYFLLESNVDSFTKIFNLAFNIGSQNEYELLSVIEPGDVVGMNWFKNVDEYLSEDETIDIFFPLIRNSVNGVFNSLMNEAPWVEGLAEEAGRADLNLLLRFNCLIPLGAVLKIESVKAYSEEKEDGLLCPMKESFRISHYYEFFMRMVYNDLKTLTIPRIGYELRMKQTDYFVETSTKIPFNVSQLPKEKGGISPDEGQFWLELAKKEYFFDEDHNKKYEGQ